MQSYKTWQQILQPCHLYLQHCFSGFCPGCKNLQNQRRTIHDCHSRIILNIPELGRCQRIIEQKQVCLQFFRFFSDLPQFSRSHINCFIDLCVLHTASHYFHLAGICQLCKLCHRTFKLSVILRIHAYQIYLVHVSPISFSISKHQDRGFEML